VKRGGVLTKRQPLYYGVDPMTDLTPSQQVLRDAKLFKAVTAAFIVAAVIFTGRSMWADGKRADEARARAANRACWSAEQLCDIAVARLRDALECRRHKYEYECEQPQALAAYAKGSFREALKDAGKVSDLACVQSCLWQMRTQEDWMKLFDSFLAQRR